MANSIQSDSFAETCRRARFARHRAFGAPEDARRARAGASMSQPAVPAESVQESAANLLMLGTWAKEGEGEGEEPGDATAPDPGTPAPVAAAATSTDEAAAAPAAPAPTMTPSGGMPNPTLALSPGVMFMPANAGLFRVVQVGGMGGVPQMMALSQVPQPLLAQKVGKSNASPAAVAAGAVAQATTAATAEATTPVAANAAATAAPTAASAVTTVAATATAAPAAAPAPVLHQTPPAPPSLPPMPQMIQMPPGGWPGVPMLLAPANGMGGAGGMIQLPPGAQLPPGIMMAPVPGMSPMAADDAGGPMRRRATSGKQGWTREEDQHILHQVQTSGQKWSVIAAMLPGRTDDAVRNRYLRLQKKRQRGRYNRDTSAQPNSLGLQDLNDCASVKKGDMWAAEEDQRIVEGVMRFGQKWQQISELLPGRSANAVRNRYLRCEGTSAYDPATAGPAAMLSSLGGVSRPPVTATIQQPNPEAAGASEGAPTPSAEATAVAATGGAAETGVVAATVEGYDGNGNGGAGVPATPLGSAGDDVDLLAGAAGPVSDPALVRGLRRWFDWSGKAPSAELDARLSLKVVP